MRAQLDRVEKLERATGANRPPFDAIHHYLYAPSESGPLLVGAYGPIGLGALGVRPVKIDRSANETEANFLRHVEVVFSERRDRKFQ